MNRTMLSVLFLPLAAFPAVRLLPDTIENFDSDSIELLSFPGEDINPDMWLLDPTNTPDSSPFSLKLTGNTWKLEPIAPRALDSSTVWQVSAYVGELGEIQGFGLADTAETLFYSFAGSEQVDPARWVTVYQGAFPLRTWNTYQLPVGEDWLARFGYLPTVTALVFLNDRDTDPRSEVSFDLVLDITPDLPIAPGVEVWHSQLDTRQQSDGSWLVTVQFYSRVTDPDSPDHAYSWSFGDGGTSADSWPVHTYVVFDDHEYTVLLEVNDPTGRRGRATCRVNVDPGPSTFPVRLNFVGDVMLARRYDLPGGLIDTLGLEGIFAPTRHWLGNAAHITVANLECQFTTSNDRHPTKPIVFKARPSNVAGLTLAGIDVVSLANNHIVDYGLAGLNQTRHLFDSLGIVHSGAGADLYEACLPIFRQQSGLNIAFLALCNRNGQYDNYQPYLDAGWNKPGFAFLDSFRIRQLLQAVEPVSDLRIVQMHSGVEYALEPDLDDECYSRFALVPAASEIELRHQAVDLGASLVVCHHPHVLQGFEVYRGRIIAHSLGNFAFDQEYPETYPSAILNVEADSTGISAGSVIPIYIDDYVPRRASGELGCHILDYIARRSRELNTILVVDRESVTAFIVLDTVTLSPTVVPHSARLGLDSAGGYWKSTPLRLPRF
ncbi:MAG: CapA family protein, partial [candidate division WOR-3 bacterium]